MARLLRQIKTGANHGVRIAAFFAPFGSVL